MLRSGISSNSSNSSRMVSRSLASVATPVSSWLVPATLPVNCRTFTSTVPLPQSSFVAVNHAEAYEAAMQGPHGKQLALAKQEGVGKDLAPLDPFLEMDLEEDHNKEEEDPQISADGDVEEDQDDDDDDYDDDGEDTTGLSTLYNPDGSLRRKKSVLKTLRAGFPAGGQLAVIELGGTQFKVTTDDVIVVNRLKPVETYSIGSVHTLKDVMLVGSSHLTLVGLPFVKGAEVDVMVEEITRDAKVIIFKKRRRKHSQRKNGFRRDVTLLRVLDIRMPQEYRNHSHIGREIVDSLEEQFELQAAAATAVSPEMKEKVTRTLETGKLQSSTTL